MRIPPSRRQSCPSAKGFAEASVVMVPAHFFPPLLGRMAATAPSQMAVVAKMAVQVAASLGLAGGRRLGGSDEDGGRDIHLGGDVDERLLVDDLRHHVVARHVRGAQGLNEGDGEVEMAKVTAATLGPAGVVGMLRGVAGVLCDGRKMSPGW